MIEKLTKMFGRLEVRLELTEAELKVFERYFADDHDYAKLPETDSGLTVVVLRLGQDE